MEEMELVTAYLRTRYTEELKAYLEGTGIRFPENTENQERNGDEK